MPGLSDYVLTPEGGLVHKTANIVGNVRIGEGSRIDAFVTITGEVRIGKYTHIGLNCSLLGGSGIDIGDYVGISPGARIFSATEDVSGEWVTNPTVPANLRNPKARRIVIADHAFIGTNAVVLPGAELGEGSGLGALSLAKHALLPWSIYAGSPALLKYTRSQGVKDKISNDPANRGREYG